VPTGPVALVEGLEVEAAWMMERGGSLYVGVHVTAAPGSNTPLPRSGRWTLRLHSGATVVFEAEHAHPSLPGVITLEFSDTDAADVAALAVRPAVDAVAAGETWEIETDALPWRGPAPGPIAEVGDVTVLSSSIRIADTGGEVAWSLVGGDLPRALVDAVVEYTVPGGERRVAIPEHELPGVPLTIRDAPPGAAASGTVQLYRLDDPDEPTFRSRFWGDPGTVEVEGPVVIEWAVVLYTYAEDAVEIPLDDVPEAG
jgi:hypothetical protein